jgi:MFS family permease
VPPSLRALAHHNYRLFFAGQGVSLLGSWMNRLASSWLVYRLTNDPFMLGIINFASLGPAFLLAPLAGVIVDQRDVRRLLLLTQCVAALVAAGLAVVAALALEPEVTIAAILALNVVQGLVNAFDVPARQVLLPRMIPERSDLANGIALNSTLFHAARLVGPGIAGVIVAAYGEFWCFLVDAVSYIAVVAAIAAMRLPERPPRTGARPRLLGSFKEGMQYAFRTVPIRNLLLLIACVSFMGMPYTVLLPVYAREIFGGDARVLGYLTSAAGLGALIGAVGLARRESLRGMAKLIVGAGILFALSVVGFAFSDTLIVSMAMLLGAGFGMITQSAAGSTILQTIVDDDKRGRVMSLYSTAFLGVAPFGGLVAGYVARALGAPYALAIGAVACAVATAVFAVKIPQTRRWMAEHGLPLKQSHTA